MQRLEVSGAVRLIYISLGVKGLSPTVRRVLLFKQCCSASVPFSDSNIIEKDAYTFEPNHERPLYKCWTSNDIGTFP